MFKLSCGFFVKSKEQKSNQERNTLLRPGQMQMQKDVNINTDTNLPTPASGYVYFTRQTPQYKQNPLIVPVGTILTTDYGNMYAVVPDVVTPNYNNPKFSSQYNAYICNALDENLAVSGAVCKGSEVCKTVTIWNCVVSIATINAIDLTYIYVSHCAE